MELSDRPKRRGSQSRALREPRRTLHGGDSEAVVRAVRAFQVGIEREESFRVLFDVYRPTVQGFFLRRLASAELAHDLTQETFLRVYKGLEGYRREGPFGAWLFRIAWNVLRDRRGGSAAARLRAREVRLEDLALELPETHGNARVGAAGDEPRALSSVLRAERRAALRSAIERLPPQRRRCVILWAYHELTYEQIAVALRLAIGTVKAHLAQARRQLGELVEELVPDPER